MKHNLLAASLAFAAFVAVSPALATCSSCNIQTKTPSATAPGKFDHRGRSGFSLCGNDFSQSLGQKRECRSRRRTALHTAGAF
jgi:hypothetical protein